MNDITALIESLKEPTKKAIELGHIKNYAKGRHAVLLFQSRATAESVLALIEALEKAHQQIVELQQGCENDPHIHEIIDLKEHIASLESRTVTVKLPEEFSDDEALLQEIEFCDDVSTDIQTAQWLKELRRRRAAGIQVIEGEG